MYPLNLTQHWPIFDDVLISGQKHLKLTVSKLLSLDLLAHVGGAFVKDHFDARCPFFKLNRPIGHRREGNDDKIWSWLLFVLDEPSDQ